MDISKYKSIALSQNCYKQLKVLAAENFEMPQSLAKSASYFIQKAYEKYKANGNKSPR